MPGTFKILLDTSSENDSCWQVKLTGINALSGDKAVLARVPESQIGYFATGTTGINPLAIRLVERLDALDTRLADLNDTTGDCEKADSNDTTDIYPRSDFWLTFSDGYLMQPAGSTQFLTLDPGKNLEADSTQSLAICAAFYKAVNLFLNSEDRTNAMEAWLASAYAAWQWYNLCKHLLIRFEEQSVSILNSVSSDPIVEDQVRIQLATCRTGLAEELAAAHHQLVQTLEDPRYAFALRWMARWVEIGADGYPSGPLLREQVRLSLPLWQTETNAKLNPTSPISAPGCLANSKIIWTRTGLHPSFVSEPGRSAVRQLITQWLLPRYDFDHAIRLGNLLKKNKQDQWTSVARYLPLIILAIVVIAVVSGSLVMRANGGMDAPSNVFWITLACTALVSLLFPLILSVWLLDHHILPHLMMPRVVGGVFIGYLALVMESNSLNITNVLWSRGFILPLLLFAAVAAAGFGYLYYDTRPLVRDCARACRRSLYALGLAGLISAITGLLVTAITTANQGSGGYHGIFSGVFLGPFGWVDFPTYIIFVPVALFTGLVTQFIFEELTLPASVWSPEQE